MKTLFITIVREIKYNFGRFISLFAITALGVGFLAGLLSTAPDLYNSVDSYYDNQCFMDFNIKSSYGFSYDDLEAVKSENYVDKVVGARVIDLMAQNGDNDDSVARIFDFDNVNYVSRDSGSGINYAELVSGRYPENDYECVAAISNGVFEKVELGTEITLKPEKDILQQTKLKVVGLVNSPMYMSIEKEKSSIGNGRVSMLLYPYRHLFYSEEYTDIFLTLKGSEKLNTFNISYDDYCEKYSKKIEKIVKSRQQIQFEKLKNNAVINALYSTDGKPLYPQEIAQQIKEKAENAVPYPEWYILGRDANVSFASISSNAEKVNSIAKVFPIFFFLVAALVALTTMTRMVDEDRTDIGTMKALGYSNKAIMGKYMFYSGIAAVFGGIFGLCIGLYVLPTVIINTYKILYRLPPVIISLNPYISITALLVAVLCIEGAALLAVISNLKDVPTTLMLPKAPKSGKRILLERISFIWKRMKFTHKVTARNLFRYKKRFFMTVIGISGCTALLLTGFGLNNAIGDIVAKQYDDIHKYSLTVQLNCNDDIDNTMSYFDKYSEGYIKVHAENAGIYDNKKECDINIYVPSQIEKFSDYIVLRERKNGKKIAFDKNSVIVTEKFAANHNIKIGSTVTIKNKTGKKADAKITGICENYIYSYVYMGAEKYESLFNETFDFSTLLVKSNAKDEDTVMTDILSFKSVSSAFFSSSVTTSFKHMIEKINYIVIVLIISAGLLAFVVLYNLTNINISERQKEIATIKVLGFFDREVNSYICREIYILTLIGTALGLFFGIFLCRFVIVTAEVDMVMFGRTIYPYSYIFSAVITIFFTAIVNIFMSFKLRKIDMVESMKSVD